MALAKTHSVSLFGLSGTVIEVEADITAQLPAFVLVGLPDASLSEATARVRAAMGNSGFGFPSRKVVVNLSPAAVPKSGSGFDLSIALAVLVAMEVLPQHAMAGICLAGELGLDGTLRSVPGVLPMTLRAMQAGFTRMIVPSGNAEEASMVSGIEILAASNLAQVVGGLRGTELFSQPGGRTVVSEAGTSKIGLDLDQVIGQQEAIEGLIVAAAGGHHVSMIGAPGAGKTMLAERLPTILPKLSTEQALEVAAIESIAGDGQAGLGLNQEPRFQAPHHSTSVAALIGGGSGSPKPGSVSRAHHGVLFLDEALEFHGSTLDSLREPLESGRIIINRSAGSAVFPARFQLVLAANPCPCGFAGVPDKTCTCAPMAVRRYLNRLSGPILDRIDIRLMIRPVGLAGKLGLTGSSVTSAEAAKRVTMAREAARVRLAPFGLTLNSQVPGTLLRRQLAAEQRGMRELDKLVSAGNASMRGFDRCLRLAWTLADLEGESKPNFEHIQLAVALRGNDKLGDS